VKYELFKWSLFEKSMTSPGVILKAFQLDPKKHLGQNFLKDPSVSEMIVKRSGVSEADSILEIGPGLGSLTIPLMRAAGKLFAIEKDPALIPLLKAEILAKNLSLDKIEIQNRNVLDVDFFEFENRCSGKMVAFGNLPYNISSQVLVKLIQSRRLFKKAVFMFQKELSERLVAAPGGKEYGRLSVALRYCSDIRTIALVKKDMFYPKPKVDSEVIEIVFKEKPDQIARNEDFFFKVIKAAFGRRRKTLKNALLGSELPIDGQTTAIALEKAAIDPSRRAETLTVNEFVTLTNILEEEMGHRI
jgi:16S rRNA (adenine1518-N6/adenine1519-N6)-dimethyltransferase